MIGRILKYTTGAVVFLLVLYFSVDIQKLDEVQKQRLKDTFDPAAYAKDFWHNRLLNNLAGCVNPDTLVALFRSDMPSAVRKYGRTLGVSSTHSYLLCGEGVVTEASDEGARILTPGGTPLLIATDYIFGNAIRDASGLVDVSDFPSTMEFNHISTEINDIVRQQVAAPVLSELEPGRTLRFTGAAEVSEQSPQLDPLKVIPIILKTGDRRQ